MSSTNPADTKLMVSALSLANCGEIGAAVFAKLSPVAVANTMNNSVMTRETVAMHIIRRISLNLAKRSNHGKAPITFKA